MMFRQSNGNRCGRRARERGFTLVELMITLAILGLIMSVVYRVFSSQERMFRTQEQVASVQENLRATVEYLNQEMSWIGYQVPGTSVVKASDNDIIFRANIPNTATPISFVRYRFDSGSRTILRWAGPTAASVAGTPVIMATDIESLSFSYFNVQNDVIVPPAGDPLCSDILSAQACSPSAPENDDVPSLLMIQRVKTRITARTSRPDYSYNDPETTDPNSINFRKRSAVLDVRARNIEDVTIVAGQIGLGDCGNLIPHVYAPQTGSPYNACRDKLAMLDPAIGHPDDTYDWTDNPYVTVEAYTSEGYMNSLADMSVTILATGSDGQKTLFNVYDPTNYNSSNNSITNGETRYIAANALSNVTAGNTISVKFNYLDGVCTMIVVPGSNTISIGPGDAAYFDTTGTYGSSGLDMKYVDLGTGNPLTPVPSGVAMCSTAAHEGVSLEARIMDECGNAVPGESLIWDDGGIGGSFIGTTPVGDGTYGSIYVPPDSMSGAPQAQYPVTLTAQWGSFTLTDTVNLIAADSYDIIIDSIIDVTQSGIFDFDKTVPPRSAQLGNDSGSGFEIERMDGQVVEIRFHVEDGCGNWVFNEETNLTLTPYPGFNAVGPVTANPDGSYSVQVYWDNGCGGGLTGSMEISSSSITNAATDTETIAFELFETRSSVGNAGPWLQLNLVPAGEKLQAGNTSDSVLVSAVLSEYNTTLKSCSNIPGVFTIDFTVTGDAKGNGSFADDPYDETTSTKSTDASGVADVTLYSGTADWDTSLIVAGNATIVGATYSASISVDMKETGPPIDERSGIYQDSLYATEIGASQANTQLNPGASLYIQIFDYDENKDPYLMDSQSPVDLTVTVQSQRTGDVETVGLTESNSNTAEFRNSLATEFEPVAVIEDGTLQVRDGDTITVYYEDPDQPADNYTWTVYTQGAEYLKVFKVNIDDSETLIAGSGPAQLPTVLLNNKVRPRLSLPYLASDGSANTDTVQITVVSGSGDDTDTLVLREEGDDGTFVPDTNRYAGAHFSVADTDPTDEMDILYTPTTPRFVTLTYDELGAYAKTAVFFMKDTEPPEVIINAPSDGDTVNSTVTIEVEVNDVNNATPWAGISEVYLYINDRLVDSKPGTGPTGTYIFTWHTISGTSPTWLDGSHTIQAKAIDASNNLGESAPVGVNLNNGLTPIRFTAPPYGSVWSEDVDFTIEVQSLAADAGTHLLEISVNGSLAYTIEVLGDGSHTRTVELNSTDYGPLADGTVTLLATITDLGGNAAPVEAPLDFIVDRVPPNIAIGYPLNQTWINRSDFPLTVSATVTDANGVSTVTGEFSGVCSSATLTMTESPAGSGNYDTDLWPISNCGAAEGVLEFTVHAMDVALMTGNDSSRMETARVDTIRPTVTVPTVDPIESASFTLGGYTMDGFITGTVDLSATVTDTWPDIGAFFVQYYQDSGTLDPTPPASWVSPAILGPVDASSSVFTYSWNTSGYPDGIYPISAGAMDLAGNSNISSGYALVYVDNTDPWIDVPDLQIPTGVVRGPMYVNRDASDEYGFLKEVEHRFVNQGDNPDIVVPVYSEVRSFTVDQERRTLSNTYVVDTSSWPNGDYEAYAYVTDWAGHTVRSGPTASFEVQMPLTLDPSSAYVSTTDVAGQWQITVHGRLLNQFGTGAANVPVQLFVYRYAWNGSSYATTDYEYSTVTTDALGNVTFTSTMLYDNTDRYRVYYTDVTSGSSLGYLTGYFGSPFGGYTPWSSSLYTYQNSLVSNLQYSSHVDVADTSYVIMDEVSGNLIRRDGTPAEGVTIRLYVQRYDLAMPGYEYYSIYQTTGPNGEFSFVNTGDNMRVYRYEYEYLRFYDDSGRYMGMVYWYPTGQVWNDSLY